MAKPINYISYEHSTYCVFLRFVKFFLFFLPFFFLLDVDDNVCEASNTADGINIKLMNDSILNLNTIWIHHNIIDIEKWRGQQQNQCKCSRTKEEKRMCVDRLLIILFQQFTHTYRYIYLCIWNKCIYEMHSINFYEWTYNSYASLRLPCNVRFYSKRYAQSDHGFDEAGMHCGGRTCKWPLLIKAFASVRAPAPACVCVASVRQCFAVQSRVRCCAACVHVSVWAIMFWLLFSIILLLFPFCGH